MHTVIAMRRMIRTCGVVAAASAVLAGAAAAAGAGAMDDARSGARPRSAGPGAAVTGI